MVRTFMRKDLGLIERAQSMILLVGLVVGLFVATAYSETNDWKTDIVTGIFWVGAGPGRGLSDPQEVQKYGGVDNPDPSARNNYEPAAFHPLQNPFYCALPYSDVFDGKFKSEAPEVVPWFYQAYRAPGVSVCRHHWIEIRKGDLVCYAQWEDCGPYRTDHFRYVFGNEQPKEFLNDGLAFEVSPAVRDYLGLKSKEKTDWRFVDAKEVPPGPWTKVINW